VNAGTDTGEATALVLRLADVEDVLGPVRAEFHPTSVGRGLPLHMTLLYPFVAREALDDAVLGRLRGVCAANPAFSFSLNRVATFPGGFVCLVPEPDEEVRALMRALWAEFPETPPYGGEVGEPDPHATVGWAVHGHDDPELLRAVRDRVEPLLPVRCDIGSVALYEEYEQRRWRELLSVPLGRDG